MSALCVLFGRLKPNRLNRLIEKVFCTAELSTYNARHPNRDGMDAGIAQLVEHNLAKVRVASSSLVSRSNFSYNQTA